MDGAGNVYVSGNLSHNVFKITPGGTITQLIDSTGDGSGNTLASAGAVAVDGSGNVFVVGVGSDNAFKITSGGAVSEIIDSTAGGAGTLTAPIGIAADAAGNVFVSGNASSNGFKIAPGGTVTKIIDSTGDGMGNTLDAPGGFGVVVSGADIYVTGSGGSSNNAFKISGFAVPTLSQWGILAMSLLMLGYVLVLRRGREQRS